MAQVIGKYELFDKVAAGGMATVHLGRFRGEGGFSRTVALKRLHPQFAADPNFVAMFLDEARVASRVRHPNVVSTLDVVSDGGEVLLVMDYIVGESLAGLMRAARPGPVPAPIALTIMIAVLHGLHAAHEATTEQGEPLHLVHRDVSPQNILVGSDGVARVLDFGIAKAARRSHTTRDGEIKGKLSYMAPEQLSNRPLDRRSDVYGAAVVLWECLTGDRLFYAETEAGVVMRVLQFDVAPPSSKHPTLPSTLDAVVARGISRDVDTRYATAREMAMALERCGVNPAPVSDVGEWVETLSRDVLASRAGRVAAIEKETDPGLPLASNAVGPSVDVEIAMPTATSMDTLALAIALAPTDPGSATPSTSSRFVTSTTVSPPPLVERKKSSRAFVPLLLAAVLLLIGFGGIGVYLASTYRTARTAAKGEPGPSTPPSSALTGFPVPEAMASESPSTASVTTGATPPSGAAGTAAPASASAARVVLAPPRTLRPGPVSNPVTPNPPPPKKPAVDCSVPYLVDSGGIRRLKPECL